MLGSFSKLGIALIFGAGGGIGGALLQVLQSANYFSSVLGFGRTTTPPIDLLDEPTMEEAARFAAQQGEVRLVIDATGFLHDEDQDPERSWKEINAQHMARSFALNAIGPALLMKHVLPHLPKQGKSVFATLSARVGSIEDNRLGGWYAYRASKAALNQLVRTAAIELRRRCPEAVCVAMHPGTVATPLSAPFMKSGLKVVSPQTAALNLISVVNGLSPQANGCFFDSRGDRVPW